MNYYVIKTDPDTYSVEDFIRDQTTNWDGVHNNQALIYIRSWKPGDRLYFYHSQGENSIVALAEVVGLPEPDPNDTRKSWYAKVRIVKALPDSEKLTLKAIKESGLFSDWLFVRNGRLSVAVCPEEFVQWAEKQGLKF
ncbi:MAG: hypothetical protein OHK0017_09020 [Patescibacteria group bacterium]